MPPKRDALFADTTRSVGDFNFGEQTAEVFDDMLDRSVPMYRELQRMIGEMAGEFATEGSNVYDLGCSTGITLETLHLAVGPGATLVGLDYSEPMLDRARQRFRALLESGRMRLEKADLNRGCVIENASVVVLNLTLQFVRPLYRDNLMRQIVSGLNDNGVLILVEKVLAADSTINRLFIKFYYDMKRRNGYDEMEIAQKREALENVLIPYRVDENVELLRRSGFQEVETFFRWYNFCGFLAFKRG
ncbi:MAG TPA: carboxy-S-adenosyl-L-methionine synthase CmoA [Burkholderiales bacterium]|nr:carboxy-S-adenosyl-L-methionine synthase CmoA [Betaproteobacteria bacterium]HQR53003.1 carboxy-S-adenosyl-L-methionine synthase CmoA [Burkholderiales bacterium]